MTAPVVPMATSPADAPAVADIPTGRLLVLFLLPGALAALVFVLASRSGRGGWASHRSLAALLVAYRGRDHRRSSSGPWSCWPAVVAAARRRRSLAAVPVPPADAGRSGLGRGWSPGSLVAGIVGFGLVGPGRAADP